MTKEEIISRVLGCKLEHVQNETFPDADINYEQIMSCMSAWENNVLPQWNLYENHPEHSDEILLLTKNGSMYIGYFKLHRKLYVVYGIGKEELTDVEITHWMEKPKSHINIKT